MGNVGCAFVSLSSAEWSERAETSIDSCAFDQTGWRHIAIELSR